MKRSWRKETWVILSLCLVIVFWVASGAIYSHSILPSAMGMTMAELEQQIGKPESLRPHMHNGGSFTIWTGPTKVIFFPSGPPVYVFDSAGKLLDWSQDIGDDPAFRVKWGL